MYICMIYLCNDIGYFFFNVTATTNIYTYCHTLSLHDALPISGAWCWGWLARTVCRSGMRSPPVFLTFVSRRSCRPTVDDTLMRLASSKVWCSSRRSARRLGLTPASLGLANSGERSMMMGLYWTSRETSARRRDRSERRCWRAMILRSLAIASVPARRNDAATWLLRRSELGRGSCRESGCQFV